MKKMWKKTLSLLMTLSMVITMMPAVAWAENTCAHVHNAECGYVAAQECQHVCSLDNDCITPLECTHVHDDNCYAGCTEEHTHGEGCDVTACTHTVCDCPKEKTNCLHGDNHDSTCGYFEGVACGHTTHDESCVPTGNLDMANGSVVIDADGYTIEGYEKVNFTGNYTITQTGTETLASYVHIAGGTHNITLDNVNLNGSKIIEQSEARTLFNNNNAKELGPFMIYGNADVTVVLKGDNTLTSSVEAAGLEVFKGSSVTIKVPDEEADNYGKLTATTTVQQPAGIGGSRNRDAGSITILSGTIDAKSGGAYASGIGPGRAMSCESITISGGVIKNRCGNEAARYNYSLGTNGSKKVTTLTITGGVIDTNGIAGETLNISGGTIEANKTTPVEYSTLSVTGGNIITTATLPEADSNGRKLAKIYVVDTNGEAQEDAETEITVKTVINEEEKDLTWKALTDSEGLITTYLLDTDKVNDTEKLPDGWLIGGECICDTATLTFKDTADEVDVYSADMDMDVVVRGACDMPIHKDVEVVCVIESVTLEDGTSVNKDDYASYADGTLTLKPAGNTDNYTVKLRAMRDVYDTPVYHEIKVWASNEVGRKLDVSNGPITVTAGTGENEGKVVYTQNSNTFAVGATDKVIITGTSSENNIEINTDATIVLRDLSLTDIKAKSPIKLTGNATLNLWLEGENELITGVYNHDDGTDRLNGTTTAAIFVESGSTLIIDSETGTLTNDDIDAEHYGDKQQGYAGSLLAKNTGSRGGASAIGGDYFADPNMACGNITIKGGNVTVQATLASNKYASGAAIGSGYTGQIDDDGTMLISQCGDITISGGNIRALAAEGNTTPGRAISSGEGDLTITGGVIYASAPNDGWNGNSSGSIYSYNGTLTIGEENGDDSDLYLYAGTTTTDVGQGDNAAPAIGVSSGGTLNILSGTITAESTGNGPAIGVAPYAPVTEDPVKLNIAGGSIDLILADESQAGTPAAIGIGGNNYDNPIEINISGGSIESDKLNIGVRGNQDSTVNISGDAQVNIANGNLVGDLNVSDEADVTIGGDVKGAANIVGGSVNDIALPESVTSIAVPAGKLNEVAQDETGNIVLPEGSMVEQADGTEITLTGGGSLNSDGTVTIEEGGTVEQADGTEITLGGGGSLGTDGAVTMYEGTATIEKDGETTTVVIPEDAEGTVNGSTVTLPTGSTVTLPDGSDVTVSNGGSVDLENGTVTQNKTPSAGYRPSSKKYSVSIDGKDMENGSVKLSNSSAKKGATVTITVTPDAGYMLDKLTVTDKDGNKLALKNVGNGKYSFTMPRGGVEVDASFKESDGSEPSVDTKETAIVLTIDSTLILIDGEYVVNDVAPIIRGERTVLPIRVIAEALGAAVTWNEAEQTVTIVKGDTTIVLYIGQAFALVNGDPVQLDAPAFIENGRTYLPLRFIMENLGASVVWDGLTKTVTILG